MSQSLTDYIMEGGKNGADYLKALFRTLILRPVISATINPLAGAVNGALFGSAGGAAGGVASGGDFLAV